MCNKTQGLHSTSTSNLLPVKQTVSIRGKMCSQQFLQLQPICGQDWYNETGELQSK